jgi:hypothetical protein
MLPDEAREMARKAKAEQALRHKENIVNAALELEAKRKTLLKKVKQNWDTDIGSKITQAAKAGEDDVSITFYDLDDLYAFSEITREKGYKTDTQKNTESRDSEVNWPDSWELIISWE